MNRWYDHRGQTSYYSGFSQVKWLINATSCTYGQKKRLVCNRSGHVAISFCALLVSFRSLSNGSMRFCRPRSAENHCKYYSSLHLQIIFIISLARRFNCCSLHFANALAIVTSSPATIGYSASVIVLNLSRLCVDGPVHLDSEAVVDVIFPLHAQWWAWDRN